MIEPHDEQFHRESMLMPLLFASYDNYVCSSKSFYEGWNWIEDLKICQKPSKYGQVMFCEAFKVDISKKNRCKICQVFFDRREQILDEYELLNSKYHLTSRA